MTDYSLIRVIGFDLDQTLYPKSPAVDEAIQKYIYEKIAEHRGIELEEAERLFKEHYRAGAGLSGSQSVEALGVPNGREVVQEALERANIAATLSPDQGINRMLSALKQKYAGFDLITGSMLSEAQSKLNALSIPLELFDHAITADAGSKSDGSAFKLWLDAYREFKPDQFLYIGDRVMTDYEIPKSLGIQCILVNQNRIDPTVSCPQIPNLSGIEALL